MSRSPRPLSRNETPLPVGQLLVECTICGWYHPQAFNGDCRDDSNSFETPDNDEWETEFFDVNDPRQLSAEEVVEQLLEVTGNFSIVFGVITLEDGTTIDLHAVKLSKTDTTGERVTITT